MKTDPAVRKDGLCACGCGRTLPARTLDPKALRAARRYSGQSLEADPFATTRCCRVFHDCVLDGELDEKAVEKKAAAGRRGRAASRRPALAAA